jgi:hypothetical protein
MDAFPSTERTSRILQFEFGQFWLRPVIKRRENSADMGRRVPNLGGPPKKAVVQALRDVV